jgi:AraC-like DNA-binding protein
MLSASPEPAACFQGRPMRVTDLVLAGAEARLNLFVPNKAIVFILVVPSSETISKRTLRIRTDADPPGLIRSIKQPRGGAESRLASVLRNETVASQEWPGASRRVAAAMSACRLIERVLPAALTLDELSREAGVGARALQHGFREMYGTTPLNFVRSLRLTRSRLALLRSKSYTPISEIASAVGFRHMGQFAQDYRRWFGETPSMTLARVSPRTFVDPGLALMRKADSGHEM